MNFLSNWIFWVIILAIIFLLAIVGYLTESRKKNKKESSEVKPEVQPAEPTVQPAPTVDNSNVVSPVNPGAVLNLDNGTWNNSVPAEPVVEQTTSTDDWSVMPEVAPVAEPVQVTPEAAPVAEPVQVTPEAAPVAEPVQVTPEVTAQEKTDNSSSVEIWK